MTRVNITSVYSMAWLLFWSGLSFALVRGTHALSGNAQTSLTNLIHLVAVQQPYRLVIHKSQLYFICWFQAETFFHQSWPGSLKFLWRMLVQLMSLDILQQCWPLHGGINLPLMKAVNGIVAWVDGSVWQPVIPLDGETNATTVPLGVNIPPRGVLGQLFKLITGLDSEFAVPNQR